MRKRFPHRTWSTPLHRLHHTVCSRHRSQGPVASVGTAIPHTAVTCAPMLAHLAVCVSCAPCYSWPCISCRLGAFGSWTCHASPPVLCMVRDAQLPNLPHAAWPCNSQRQGVSHRHTCHASLAARGMAQRAQQPRLKCWIGWLDFNKGPQMKCCME
jgi:hypothetical protein